MTSMNETYNPFRMYILSDAARFLRRGSNQASKKLVHLVEAYYHSLNRQYGSSLYDFIPATGVPENFTETTNYDALVKMGVADIDTVNNRLENKNLRNLPVMAYNFAVETYLKNLEKGMATPAQNADNTSSVFYNAGFNILDDYIYRYYSDSSLDLDATKTMVKNGLKQGLSIMLYWVGNVSNIMASGFHEDRDLLSTQTFTFYAVPMRSSLDGSFNFAVKHVRHLLRSFAVSDPQTRTSKILPTIDDSDSNVEYLPLHEAVALIRSLIQDGYVVDPWTGLEAEFVAGFSSKAPPFRKHPWLVKPTEQTNVKDTAEDAQNLPATSLLPDRPNIQPSDIENTTNLKDEVVPTEAFLHRFIEPSVNPTDDDAPVAFCTRAISVVSQVSKVLSTERLTHDAASVSKLSGFDRSLNEALLGFSTVSRPEPFQDRAVPFSMALTNLAQLFLLRDMLSLFQWKTDHAALFDVVSDTTRSVSVTVFYKLLLENFLSSLTKEGVWSASPSASVPQNMSEVIARLTRSMEGLRNAIGNAELVEGDRLSGDVFLSNIKSCRFLRRSASLYFSLIWFSYYHHLANVPQTQTYTDRKDQTNLDPNSNVPGKLMQENVVQDEKGTKSYFFGSSFSLWNSFNVFGSSSLFLLYFSNTKLENLVNNVLRKYDNIVADRDDLTNDIKVMFQSLVDAGFRSSSGGTRQSQLAVNLTNQNLWTQTSGGGNLSQMRSALIPFLSLLFMFKKEKIEDLSAVPFLTRKTDASATNNLIGAVSDWLADPSDLGRWKRIEEAVKRS